MKQIIAFFILINFICGCSHIKERDDEITFPQTFYLIRFVSTIALDGDEREYIDPETPRFVGKFTIYQDGKIEKFPSAHNSKLDNLFLEYDFNSIFKNGIKYRQIYRKDPKIPDAYKTTCWEKENTTSFYDCWRTEKTVYFPSREFFAAIEDTFKAIDPIIGEKYLKNNWSKEDKQYELLTALKTEETTLVIIPSSNKTGEYIEYSVPYGLRKYLKSQK